MIVNIRHRGLVDLYSGGNGRYVQPRHVQRLRSILHVLDESESLQDITLKGLVFHALTGPLRGHYAVRVSANWRVTFRLEDGNVYDVDYVDYH